jgi:hypothetical protein
VSRVGCASVRKRSLNRLDERSPGTAVTDPPTRDVESEEDTEQDWKRNHRFQATDGRTKTYRGEQHERKEGLSPPMTDTNRQNS